MMLLRGEELSKSYVIGDQRIHAVHAVSVDIAPGEFVAVIGHSGSGKSTLLSMLGGLTRPTSGTVYFEDESLWGQRDARRSLLRNERIGFVFQFSSLIPTLTALDNVVLPRMFGRKRVSADVYSQAEALLDTVGLTEKIHCYPSELSGGQQRRVAIARSLINRPTLLFADEPTGDLDEQTEAEVMDLLLQTLNQDGTSLLMVTHNNALAERADRVLKMKDGRML
ncbi:ABC transporter ATP-binding protein [Thioalkalivibrio paradoxus]|uniref:ABC transporter n=1 Tax=Thioalkalivibrio paradoxus ARh 1 TaxID=713585 RepID=W0DQB9_9GAMM|nr:ABC transporter ATP-binding protein [Thioalkalivibrio paradoxus]AHE99075.1 ABC transporter [Thioalkalivibrio paradoxus ARh 1]